MVKGELLGEIKSCRALSNGRRGRARVVTIAAEGQMLVEDVGQAIKSDTKRVTMQQEHMVEFESKRERRNEREADLEKKAVEQQGHTDRDREKERDEE